MAWLYVPSVSAQESVVSTSACAELLAQSVTWRGKHSPPRTWSRRFKTAPWIQLLSGLTCEPSTLERGVAEWISSQGDTPASRSPLPASGAEPTTPDTSGLTCCGCSKRVKPRSGSSRTSAVTSPRACLTCWQTLPASGSMSSGVVTQRQRLAHRTAETGSGSSLTGRDTWAMPRASDGEKGGPSSRDGSGSLHLTSQSVRWATPTSRDWKDGANPSPNAPTNGLLGRQAPRTETHGRECPKHSTRLSATFVEWLMGYPIGWTDFEHSATPSSPASLGARSSSS